MTLLLQTKTLAVPGFLRVGGVHVPIYGIFAAVGLVAALWVSQRTARQVGLNVDKLWDAGMVTVIAAFIASRVLLIAFDFKTFLAYPLLVLALPSLTYGGMLLTALLVWGWLRWKRLLVRDVLDAWAPCGAFLSAVLSGAHFVEGTDAGMPTRLPWGVTTPGDTVLGRVQPVQIYAVIAALVLGSYLLWKLPRRRFAGEVAAIALMVAGLVAFLLDMLQQPMETFSDAWLDPGQYVALAAMLAGACMFAAGRRLNPTPENPYMEHADSAMAQRSRDMEEVH